MRWTRDAHRRPSRHAFAPFGGGARKCFGDHFALTEAALALAAIPDRWHFEHPEGAAFRPPSRRPRSSPGACGCASPPPAAPSHPHDRATQATQAKERGRPPNKAPRRRAPRVRAPRQGGPSRARRS
ncbi:cytochrome P450 [Streptomyces sp. NPDC088090]|uniref:cytochrome P450 n=1 Tax=Streptomyces sp. NPDC088090 TaxID=3365822 RepID=UPI003851236A